jgi:hypothetical protein
VTLSHEGIFERWLEKEGLGQEQPSDYRLIMERYESA